MRVQAGPQLTAGRTRRLTDNLSLEQPMCIDLKTANLMIAAGKRLARELRLKPMTFCILDAGGHVVSAQREGGSNLLSFEMAFGKAWGSLGIGHSTRFIVDVLAKAQPAFADSLDAVSKGRFVADSGGVLVRDRRGERIGAMGASGDTGDNDEKLAVRAIEECGYVADLT